MKQQGLKAFTIAILVTHSLLLGCSEKELTANERKKIGRKIYYERVESIVVKRNEIAPKDKEKSYYYNDLIEEELLKIKYELAAKYKKNDANVILATIKVLSAIQSINNENYFKTVDKEKLREVLDSIEKE